MGLPSPFCGETITFYGVCYYVLLVIISVYFIILLSLPEADICESVWHVLLFNIVPWVIGWILIFLAIAEVSYQLCWCIAQVKRYG